ncbi:coiled-coil domain-containing protein 170-like [Haliotis rubra]|uniref:coiled-coil domain-containing protein 170-like n=1 Tax=Haliotis rubra TaxID=36100 RepID=UPI001EE63592|nr:coiled-coil domain-containing protein 170-like [Haliotis rubra]
MANYIRDLDRENLPYIGQLNRNRILDGTSPSARRIRELEEELGIRYQPTSPSANQYLCRYNQGDVSRRAVTELSDQLKSARDELRKKDALIQQLSSLDSAPRIHRSPDPLRVDTLFLGDRTAVEQSRSELASMQVKFEKMQIQLREAESELELKSIKVKELQHLLETNRENEAKLTALVQSLRDRVRELEDKAGSIETVAGRSEFAIGTLQRENRDSQDRILELEGRLRKQLEEREASEARGDECQKRLSELQAHLSGLLRVDDLYESTPASVETIVRKLTDLMQENAMLKGKLLSLNEALNNTEMETKASRETIMRLVSEVGREQKVATRYTSEIDSIRMERDNALAGKREVEREIELMKERLDANQRSLDATRGELELRQGRLSSLDREVRETSHNVRSWENQYHLFREQIAGLLSNSYTMVEPSEDMIKDNIRRMAQTNKEYEIQLGSLESRVKDLTEQLDNQYQMNRSSNQRFKQNETSLYDLEQRLRCTEGELAAGDVLREGLKTEKEKYMRLLQRLGEKMKMDHIALDLGFDMTIDAIMAREPQLVKLEGDALNDRSTHIYNLQRKVKSLKEQLESKDLHIDLLRKKMTSLEERVHSRSDVEKERDGESMRVRKLERLVDKYKLQLTDARQEVQNLKAHLLGSSEMKVRTIEQRKDIDELAHQVDELEELRKKQSRKIANLKSEVQYHENENQEKKVVSDNAVHALSGELRTTKTALQTIQHREKQLLDFRNVVARMLGLEINSLAVPDYEIISRLEKLIHTHHKQTHTSMNLEEALADMEDGFASDYSTTRRALEATDPLIRRSRDKSRRRAARARVRARSLSPTRRIDPRSY